MEEKRLIDADALKRLLRPIAMDLAEEYGSLGGAVSGVIMHIDNALTVDAVEVVRCRDCKYWGGQDGILRISDCVLIARCEIKSYLVDGRQMGWYPTENDFCSCGKRKDGDRYGNCLVHPWADLRGNSDGGGIEHHCQREDQP